MIIDDIDFGDLYRKHIGLSKRKSKPASNWDARAEKASRTCGDPTDPYVIEFINQMDFHGARSLLDIGCGPGTICLPVAHRFEDVYALDYSAGMLDVVRSRAQAQGINNVHVLKHSWDEYSKSAAEDAWSDVPVCDIVVASRSTMVNDMADALQKMCSKARLRAYMTSTVDRHLLSDELVACIGRGGERVVGFPNYMYAVNLLVQMGYLPRVNYIETMDCKAKESASSFDEFVAGISGSIGVLSSDEVARLKGYFERKCRDGLLPPVPRRVWALVSWEVWK